METTKNNQARASFDLLKHAAKWYRGAVDVSSDDELPANSRILGKTIVLGLMYAGILESLREDAANEIMSLASLSPAFDNSLCDSFVEFLSEASLQANEFGLDLLRTVVKERDHESSTDVSFLDNMMRQMCGTCASSAWGVRSGILAGVTVLMDELGSKWSLRHEVELINAGLLSVKSVPRELSNVTIQSMRFFVQVCIGLYGCPLKFDMSLDHPIIWDSLSGCVDGESGKDLDPDKKSDETRNSPSEDVFRLLLSELASPQQTVRYD